MAETIFIQDSTGQVYEGPAGTELPSGYRQVSSPASEPGRMLLGGLAGGAQTAGMPRSASDVLAWLSSLTAPVPHPPAVETTDTAKDFVRRGAPAVGAAIGGAGGPVGAGVGAGIGSLVGGGLAGDQPNVPQAGVDALLGVGGGLAGRLLGTGQAVTRAVSGRSAAAIKGAAGSGEQIALPETSKMAGEFSQIPLASGAIQRMVKALETKMPIDIKLISDLRQEIGQLLRFPKGQALYGALMSDLRTAAGQGSKAAETLLTNLTDLYVRRALLPSRGLWGMLEGGAAAGGITGALTGHPSAMLPAALMGATKVGQAVARTPAKPMLESLLAGGTVGISPTLNPYESAE